MKNKKGLLIIIIAIIILGFFIRQGYYYLGYLHIMSDDMKHIEPEYINIEEKTYIQNQSFEEIALDTKTVTSESLECEKNENDVYISEGIINYSCKKEDITIFYNSGEDKKFNYDEGNVIVFDEKAPFYKYETNGKDVDNYLNKNNIESLGELLMHLTKKDYIKVNFFSPVKDIKEATAFNLIKLIAVPKSDKTYIITKGQKEFRVYFVENRYVIESDLDERGFFIVLDKIPNITIDKVVNLIESIKYID